jgi:hypothetical protein
MTTIEDLCALLPAEPNGAPTQPGFYVVQAGSLPARVAEVEVAGGGVWWGKIDLRRAGIIRHAPIAFTSDAETRRADDAEAERDALVAEIERLRTERAALLECYQEGRAAMAALYETVSSVGPVGSVPNAEELGPEASHEAKAIAEVFSAVVTESGALKVEVERLQSALKRELEQKLRVAVVLSKNGCDCDCGHFYDDHDNDCERCLGCRVEAAMRSRP